MKYTFLIALLSVLNVASLPTGKMPYSALGAGYDALLLYLKRSDGTEPEPFTSARAKGGHFYYNVGIAGSVFPLQISSYGSKTAVVGNECALACNVTQKYDHGNNTYVGQVTLN